MNTRPSREPRRRKDEDKERTEQIGEIGVLSVVVSVAICCQGGIGRSFVSGALCLALKS